MFWSIILVQRNIVLASISLTDDAKKYMKEVGKPNVSLAVKGGGCAGFQYEWGVTDKDATIENLWLDPMAEMFVFGCTIDYVNELGGSYLKVVNPNATASCGCGESFGVWEPQFYLRSWVHPSISLIPIYLKRFP